MGGPVGNSVGEILGGFVGFVGSNVGDLVGFSCHLIIFDFNVMEQKYIQYL